MIVNPLNCCFVYKAQYVGICFLLCFRVIRKILDFSCFVSELIIPAAALRRNIWRWVLLQFCDVRKIGAIEAGRPKTGWETMRFSWSSKISRIVAEWKWRRKRWDSRWRSWNIPQYVYFRSLRHANMQVRDADINWNWNKYKFFKACFNLLQLQSKHLKGRFEGMQSYEWQETPVLMCCAEIGHEVERVIWGFSFMPGQLLLKVGPKLRVGVKSKVAKSKSMPEVKLKVKLKMDWG